MPNLGLAARTLALMRAQATQLLPDTCTIQSVSRSSDGAGGWSETWSTLATVACRLDPLKQQAQPETVAGREALIVPRQLTVPYDAPIDVDRRVVIGSETYEIRELVDDHSWRVCRRAKVVRVEGT